MADYNAKIAPFINVTFYVTSIFGNTGTRIHRGIDIATPSPGNELYSICNGTVYINTYNKGGFGYYVILKGDDGMGFLYAHMREYSPLQVGSRIKIGDYIGFEGTTGNSSGIHLHLEMQDISQNPWQFNADISKYLNPAEYIGIPNEQGISAIYDGVTPLPNKKINYWKYLQKNKIKLII